MPVESDAADKVAEIAIEARYCVAGCGNGTIDMKRRMKQEEAVL